MHLIIYYLRGVFSSSQLTRVRLLLMTLDQVIQPLFDWHYQFVDASYFADWSCLHYCLQLSFGQLSQQLCAYQQQIHLYFQDRKHLYY